MQTASNLSWHPKKRMTHQSRNNFHRRITWNQSTSAVEATRKPWLIEMSRKWGMVVAPQPLSLDPHPRIQPRPPHCQGSQLVLKALKKVIGSSFGPFYNLWERLQVSHCGQYSVERMLALEEYGQRVSPSRVAMVCILTPLSPLLLVSFAAYFPLRSPAEGPDENYVFWIRHLLVVGMAMLSGLMQAKAWLSELALTTRRILGITLSGSLVTTALLVLIAKLWVFPIPFMILLQSPVIIFVCTSITGLVLGRGVLRNVPDAGFRVQRYFMLIFTQSSLITIYPAYQALFHIAPNEVRPYFIALLTFVNIAMKNVLAVCGSHLEDRLPEVIVFSVDVFSALYSALCMRMTNSFKTVAIVVTLNILDTMLALHGMNRRSRVALENKSRQHKRSSGAQVVPEANEDSLGTLFQATLQLLQSPGQLDPAELRQICLLSCAEHNVSEENKARLAALAARCVYNNERRPTGLRSIAERKSRYSSTAMRGLDLSAEHFVIVTKPSSRLMQRIKAAVSLIPEAGRRLSVQIGTRLGFRTENLGVSRPETIEGEDESDTDSFENENMSDKVSGLVSADRSRKQSGPSASHLEPYLRRVSGQDSMRTASGQLSNLGGSASGLSTPGSLRRISALIGADSLRRASTLSDPSMETMSSHSKASRGSMHHLGSSRRLAELTAVSTKLETSLKLRPLLMLENPIINDILKETRKQNTVAVNQTLQLLFNNEYLGLIAYAQCITPMIYMIYTMIMQEVPNRPYYVNERDLETPERLVQRFAIIGVFVGLQTVILFGLHFFVAARFGVSTLYQVAFVLETHARLVQGKIATWLLFAVGFMLGHYGVDFSFRFRWIFEHPAS